MDDLEERFRYLEAQAYAHGMALKGLITVLIPDATARLALCNKLSASIERTLENGGATEKGHLVLPAVLDEIEALFRPWPPATDRP